MGGENVVEERKKRLIDANALTECLSSLEMIITGLRAEKGVLREFANEYRKSVLQIVDEAPTIDAVPVVRCKDCIFSKTFRTGNMYCCLHECYTFFTKPDGFCHHGAKRDLMEG